MDPPDEKLRASTLLKYGEAVDQVFELEKDVANLKREVLRREDELHALRLKAAPAAEENLKDTAAIVEAVDNVARVRGEMERALAEKARVEGVVADLRAQLDRLGADVARLTTEVERLALVEQEAARLQSELAQRESELGATAERASRTEMTAGALRAGAAMLQENLSAARKERERLVSRLRTLSAAKDRQLKILIAVAAVLTAALIWALFFR